MNFDDSLLKELGIVDWGHTDIMTPVSWQNFCDYIDQGKHLPLSYLGDYRREKRSSLIEVFNQSVCAVSFLFDYLPIKKELIKNVSEGDLKIASYVFATSGEDYHIKIKDSLTQIGEYLKTIDIDLEYKIILDIHPVLERDLAFRCGLGWFGKNSMLISKEHGSFTLIGSLLLNRKFEFKKLTKIDSDHCGHCKACVDACPTDAISIESRQVIASKCISTFTIELFKEEEIPPVGFEKAGGEIFGCDICQDVCPWNVKLLKDDNIKGQEFTNKSKNLLNFFVKRPLIQVIMDIEKLSVRAYQKKFYNTALGRTGKKGMLKNLKFWLKIRKNSPDL